MKIYKLILPLFLILSIILTITIGAKKIGKTEKIEEKPQIEGIINLWQIDSFEGGIGSRKQFLLDVACEFEKENQNVLILISNHTKTSAEENFKNGVFPDMISFGVGIDVQGAIEIETEKDFGGGKINGKTFALPWCMGGYVLISQQDKIYNGEVIEKLVVSKSELNNPYLALYLENICPLEIITKKPLDAYVDFVSKKTDYILGSQRDLVRLTNRGYNFNAYPLSKYNDFFQYISITSSDKIKREYSQKFIEFLTSERVQKKLKKIAMLSPFYKIEHNYNSLNILDKNKVFKTVSAFISKAKIENLIENVKNAQNGSNEDKIKIEKVLI